MAIPEMTYTVSGGTLNPIHSLTDSDMNSDDDLDCLIVSLTSSLCTRIAR